LSSQKTEHHSPAHAHAPEDGRQHTHAQHARLREHELSSNFSVGQRLTHSYMLPRKLSDSIYGIQINMPINDQCVVLIFELASWTMSLSTSSCVALATCWGTWQFFAHTSFADASEDIKMHSRPEDSLDQVCGNARPMTRQVSQVTHYVVLATAHTSFAEASEEKCSDA